jgi:hypothetical protein
MLCFWNFRDKRGMNLSLTVVFSLLALITAQSDGTPLRMAQYSALRSLLTGLGCPALRCPDFAANASCPAPALGGMDFLVCEDGSVVSLSVTGLKGSIDGPALGALTDLTFLDLRGNALTTIPTQIGRLRALTVLNLASSAIVGTVPSQVASLTDLGFLRVDQNELTGTLPALDKLTKLDTLGVSNNVGLGGSMPALPTTIRTLFANNCSFTALPPNLSALTALIFIRLQVNKFAGTLPVLPPFSVGACELQSSTTDSNCFVCPVSGMHGNCICSRKSVSACMTRTIVVVTQPTLATSTTPPATTVAPLANDMSTTASLPAPASTTTAVIIPAITQPTTSATSTTAPATTAAPSPNGRSSTALVSAPTSTTREPFDPRIIGVIIAVLVAVLLIGLCVFCILKRRRQQPKAVNNEAEGATELKQPSNYAVLPPAKTYGDVSDVRAVGNYVIVKSPKSEYDAPDSTLQF